MPKPILRPGLMECMHSQLPGAVWNVFVRRRENEQPLMGGAQGCWTASNIWVGPCNEESLFQCHAYGSHLLYCKFNFGIWRFFPSSTLFFLFLLFKKICIFIWLCQVLAITCRDLVLWPGIEPGLPALQEQRCSPLGHQRTPSSFFFEISFLSSHLPFLLPKLKHLQQEIYMEGYEDESARNLASGSRVMQEERRHVLRNKRTGQKIISRRRVKVVLEEIRRRDVFGVFSEMHLTNQYPIMFTELNSLQRSLLWHSWSVFTLTIT